MPTYNRIKLDITDLPPTSASKVFDFLSLLYENHLDKDYFIKHFKKYTILEQYFICYYSKIYFSESKNSFLNNELEKMLEFYGLEASLEIRKIKFNAVSLLMYIESTKFKTLRRRSKLVKSRNIPKSHLKINSGYTSYRLELYSHPKEIKYTEDPEFVKSFYTKEQIEDAVLKKTEDKISVTASSDFFDNFKSYFFTIFENEFDYEQISELFLNSFSFSGNNTYIKFLELEFDNSTVIYHKFFEIYKEYNGIQSQLLDDIKKQKEITFDIKTIRKKFIRKINIRDATKKDFMIIMYNAFPQIRESFFNFKKVNKKITLDHYLNTKSRNIKKQ